MKIAIAKEIKNHEYRVALTPNGVKSLVRHGHTVTIENAAGSGIGLSNNDYLNAGGIIEYDTEKLFAEAELIVKIKEPQPSEIERLQPHQLLFTYLHLASSALLTQQLIDRKVSAIGYETVQHSDGSLPLLQPMSLIAGRMATQIGASLLEKERGGRGVLLSGAPGVKQGNVVILGAGTVGENALKIAVGMGADVTIFNRSIHKLDQIDRHYGNQVQTALATPELISSALRNADLLIGAVLVMGAKAPQLVTAAQVANMKEGSVIVDVSIDQGGCIETIRATSHDQPSYVQSGVIHYAVPNIPAAVARTSTLALTNLTLPYIIELANRGLRHCVENNFALRGGLNLYHGWLCQEAVAAAHGFPLTPIEDALSKEHQGG